jgi:hypothetical protein
MKQASLIGLGVAAFFAMPAFAQEANPVFHHHHYAHHHLTSGREAPAPQNASAQSASPAAPGFPSFFPHIAPYPDGKGDEDGLSRDPNDCNKGCIGEP